MRPKTKTLRNRKREADRREASRVDVVPKKRKTGAERQALYRERRQALLSGRGDCVQDSSEEVVNVAARNQVSPELQRDLAFVHIWQLATRHFDRTFYENELRHRCDVCGRIWFSRDLKASSPTMSNFLSKEFPGENTTEFKLCRNCFKDCRKNKIPRMSRSNGYEYPPRPVNLPPLDPITERLISPRLPYMQIRRLFYEGSYGIIGQVINMPVSVDTMIRCLPRSLDDDFAFNVNLKKNIIHKSSYLSGFVKKWIVEAWLRYLLKQPLYKLYNITVDWTVFKNSGTELASQPGPRGAIETLNANEVSESEVIHAKQHTMLWNENHCLSIAPGQHAAPESIIFDKYAEELSFPGIYFGVARQTRSNSTNGVPSTAYTWCMSEIRRSDRRGATPQHVLYMAMKILRLRVRDSVQNMFRCLRGTENITRSMIENREYVERLLDTNQAFLRSIPNSVQYWAFRKRDLFAMMRQLGTPTAFLTISANETRWPHLIRTLHWWSEEYKHLGADIAIEEIFVLLDNYKRAHLVAEDPVICSIYFHKLVEVLMSMLCSKKKYNPFGRYRVKDYFLRIEFQHRGSPHAHVLLWLENDPREEVSEVMPRTLQMITDLCSVDEKDLNDSAMIRNQTHAHTFTCTKRGEQHCRFNIPYWPIHRTHILIPLTKEDDRRKLLEAKVKDARTKLETKAYDSIDAYLIDINCNQTTYLDLIRSTLKRPTVIFKRDMTQIFINTFHPWIASVLNSNMDVQIILDPYSCAAYVADYINKSNRGISNLHRELLKIHEANPEFDQCQLMSKAGLKLLKNVEMSSQEASWYLLRQPMSMASRATVSIPTMVPHERYKARKRKSTMDSENLPGDSTDIWTKSIIQRYEERPIVLEKTTLAQFAAWYEPTRKSVTSLDEESSTLFEDYDVDVDEGRIDGYRRRQVCKIIRYRNYDRENLENYKREMVTLHVPFRNEVVNILDRDKFLEIYDENEQQILNARREFEADINIEIVMQELEAICKTREQAVVSEELEPQASTRVLNDKPNDDDLRESATVKGICAVRPRCNVLSKQDYCTLLRQTNAEQRELILEVIHRLHEPNRQPIQVFLTGPAGCGKTFTLKALMETYNRYTQQHNSMNNAYIATATTGKAAVGINGLTVHAAFRLTISKQSSPLSHDAMHTYRHLLRNVKCLIIDEISMCSSFLFRAVDARLQGVTDVSDANFGGLDVFACGDLKQLPPVNASPVYSATRDSPGGKALLWQSLEYFPLTQVVRQRDIKFSSLLTKLGSGEHLTPEETETIQSRFRTRQWCETNLSTKVMRLYFNNADVVKYNAKAIPNTEFTEISLASDTYFNYKTETERRGAISSIHRMDTKDTGYLPYSITFTKGYPYMLTVNVNVEDGLVNGAIGILRCIEHYPSTRDKGESMRIWLEFDSTYIGRLVRIENRAHVRCKPGVLDEKWVPIEQRTVSINVGPRIKCKRLQFPLLPACALTIHKSQGGTFNQIAYEYHKNHKQQLVYVALSRVTSIDGLFLTNATDDFTFYHARCSMTPTIREVQNEYRRLENHRLPTITTRIKRFIDGSEEDGDSVVIVNVNVQSLSAHANDISTDKLLSRADIIAATETWMHHTSAPVSIDGFLLENHSSCEKRSGGVAIYKRCSNSISTKYIRATSRDTNQSQEADSHAGDIVISEISHKDEKTFILAAVYIHQQTAYKDIETFLAESLRNYSVFYGDSCKPLVLMGDFNVSDENRLKLTQFLEDNFQMKLNSNTTDKTTLGGTCIDLTFSRNLILSCKPFISYFSYHRPIFNKITKL